MILCIGLRRFSGLWDVVLGWLGIGDKGGIGVIRSVLFLLIGYRGILGI